jgi:hypothetical protein
VINHLAYDAADIAAMRSVKEETISKRTNPDLKGIKRPINSRGHKKNHTFRMVPTEGVEPTHPHGY